jgi:hypothetical protein
LRAYIIPKLFQQEDLQYLDPFGETEQDYIQEQKELLHGLQRRPSVDEAEVFHGISEFRAAHVAHNAQEFDILRHATLDEEGGNGAIGETELVSLALGEPQQDSNTLRQRRTTITTTVVAAGEHPQDQDPEEGV